MVNFKRNGLINCSDLNITRIYIILERTKSFHKSGIDYVLVEPKISIISELEQLNLKLIQDLKIQV